MKWSAYLLVLCACPTAVFAWAPEATTPAEPAAEPAADIIATDWSLDAPKARKPGVKGAKASAPRTARSRPAAGNQPRITGGARARGGKSAATVGVKMPF